MLGAFREGEVRTAAVFGALVWMVVSWSCMFAYAMKYQHPAAIVGAYHPQTTNQLFFQTWCTILLFVLFLGTGITSIVFAARLDSSYNPDDPHHNDLSWKEGVERTAVCTGVLATSLAAVAIPLASCLAYSLQYQEYNETTDNDAIHQIQPMILRARKCLYFLNELVAWTLFGVCMLYVVFLG